MSRRRLLLLLLLLAVGGAGVWAWQALPPRVALAIAMAGPAREAVHAAGLVLRRDAEPGAVVDTPTALFRTGEPHPLRVAAEVEEADIARIAVGQKALLRADAFPGRPLTAEVAQITPRGDTAHGSRRVWLNLPDDTPLRIGMTVEADIVLRETPEMVLVPPAAVLLSEAPRRATVWVVEKETAHRREVLLGAQGARIAEIRRGLTPGDAVILDPPATLGDGQIVRLRP